MAESRALARLSLALCLHVLAANELARGWGGDIEWVAFEEGLTKIKVEKKPLMLVIHKSWCGACKALKPNFAASKELKELSAHFIMVNAEDEEEPKDDKFSPDGKYIPRILFMDSSGKVLTEYYNDEGNENYKYYYPKVTQIIHTMQQVLKKSPTSQIFDEL